MTYQLQFYAGAPGVTPRLHSTDFNLQFRELQIIHQWCDDQGWRMNYDYLANAKMNKPWYFRTKEQQMWFTLRWSS